MFASFDFGSWVVSVGDLVCASVCSLFLGSRLALEALLSVSNFLFVCRALFHCVVALWVRTDGDFAVA